MFNIFKKRIKNTITKYWVTFEVYYFLDGNTANINVCLPKTEDYNEALDAVRDLRKNHNYSTNKYFVFINQNLPKNCFILTFTAYIDQAEEKI